MCDVEADMSDRLLGHSTPTPTLELQPNMKYSKHGNPVIAMATGNLSTYLPDISKFYLS